MWLSSCNWSWIPLLAESSGVNMYGWPLQTGCFSLDLCHRNCYIRSRSAFSQPQQKSSALSALVLAVSLSSFSVG